MDAIRPPETHNPTQPSWKALLAGFAIGGCVVGGVVLWMASLLMMLEADTPAQMSWALFGGTFLVVMGGVGVWQLQRIRAQGMKRLEHVLEILQQREDDLKASRQDLADKTRILQATLDSIDQGFAVWDSSYRLVVFNAKCLDFWHHPIGVARGMTMLHLLQHLAETGAFGESASPTELAERHFDKVIAAGPESEEEVHLSDGRIIFIRRYPMPDDGHASVYTDVTEERLSARALEQAKQRAERANQAKSDFLSAMSHELRTPLNGVLGFGQLMRDDPTDPLSDRHRESVNQILSAGTLLLDLINEVLDLAKIESGRMAMDITPVDVRDLLSDTVPLIENQAADRGLNLDVPDLSVAGPVVLADQKRLRQVLLNLLSNAVKYNREGGAIAISIEEAPLGICRISVTDTGHGIAEDQMDGLFEPFDRLGAENSDVEGTGIGLTISRELVEHMRGEMGVTSRPGDGSTFWVDLPLADADSAMDDDTAFAPSSLTLEAIDGPRDVLYIEDNAANRRMMEVLLGDINKLTLRQAETGESGLLMALEKAPDLVLLDINLPGMDGYAVLEKLRDDPRTQHVPVIAVTSLASDDDVRRGLEAGFDAYLSKPLDMPKTVATIRGALLSAQSLSA